MDDINIAIGKRLAARRKELGWSLAQVSQHCGVSLQQVHRYEIGQTPLSLPMLAQLSKCLGVSIEYFVEGIDQAPSSTG